MWSVWLKLEFSHWEEINNENIVDEDSKPFKSNLCKYAVSRNTFSMFMKMKIFPLLNFKNEGERNDKCSFCDKSLSCTVFEKAYLQCSWKWKPFRN